MDRQLENDKEKEKRVREGERERGRGICLISGWQAYHSMTLSRLPIQRYFITSYPARTISG